MKIVSMINICFVRPQVKIIEVVFFFFPLHWLIKLHLHKITRRPQKNEEQVTKYYSTRKKKGYLKSEKMVMSFFPPKNMAIFFACVRSFQTCLQVNFCASSSVCLPLGCILHINVFAGSITLFLQISLDLTFIFVTQFSLYFTPGSVM